MVPDPVMRMSIMHCDAAHFDKLRQMMLDIEAALRPGIERMPGLIAFYAGEDRPTLSMTNISLWDTVANARQLDTFQPMLDAGKQFVAAGATFVRPIINATTMWSFGPVPGE